MKKVVLLALAALLTVPMQISAQSVKETREKVRERQVIDKYAAQELNAKATKAAAKEAKKLAKQGWTVAPGKLPLEKQLDRAYKMQYEFDESGYPKYIIGDATSVGEIYDAAKMQANELARLDVAAQIQMEITQLIEDEVDNKQLPKEQAASIVETVSAAKNLVSQRLGRVVPVIECHRVLPNGNKEVRIVLAYNAQMAEESARQVIREQLEEKGLQLQNELNELLGFKK